MAACWELIILKYGADVANIGALSFIKVIDECLHHDLDDCQTEEEFLSAIRREIFNQCEKITNGIKNLWFVPSPFMCVCMENLTDDGAKYNNFGVHGVGVASAADSLAAIVKYLYREKRWTKTEFVQAVDENFENAPEILHRLRYETPKVGQNDDFVDNYLVFLLNCFADTLDGKTNCRGGKYRAGTGSAMYYLWHADEIGASPDGRRKGEPLGTNFSTSLFAKTGGPFSILQSMTKFRYHQSRLIGRQEDHLRWSVQRQ
jgi:formate C-acetyltransferase